jgi:hypothetical protein
MISLAAQYPVGGVKFVLFDGTAPGTSQRATVDKIVEAIPHEIVRPDNRAIVDVLTEVTADVTRIAEDEGTADRIPTYVFVSGLQKFKKLRYEEDYSFSTDDSETEANPGAQLDKLICDGARLGFHLIVTCDTYNNISRSLSRKALSEFEMRVLYQMSANDSASLIDSPAASNLGLHRAIFYNEQEGYLETFRPYASPGNEWIEEVGTKLARLLG